MSERGVKFGGKANDCSVTEDVSNRLIRLPFDNELTPKEQDRAIEAIA